MMYNFFNFPDMQKQKAKPLSKHAGDSLSADGSQGQQQLSEDLSKKGEDLNIYCLVYFFHSSWWRNKVWLYDTL